MRHDLEPNSGLRSLASADRGCAEGDLPPRPRGHPGRGPRKPRLNADTRLTLSRAFAPSRARNWAAEMADFSATGWT
jgi:hypothetical protein